MSTSSVSKKAFGGGRIIQQDIAISGVASLSNTFGIGVTTQDSTKAALASHLGIDASTISLGYIADTKSDEGIIKMEIALSPRNDINNLKAKMRTVDNNASIVTSLSTAFGSSTLKINAGITLLKVFHGGGVLAQCLTFTKVPSRINTPTFAMLEPVKEAIAASLSVKSSQVSINHIHDKSVGNFEVHYEIAIRPETYGKHIIQIIFGNRQVNNKPTYNTYSRTRRIVCFLRC